MEYAAQAIATVGMYKHMTPELEARYKAILTCAMEKVGCVDITFEEWKFVPAYFSADGLEVVDHYEKIASGVVSD